jgi:hypothetical protein
MRPSTGRISLWPAAVIGFVLVLAALSITPTLTLKTVPSSAFVESRASGVAPKAALAAGYWEVAVRVIQWKYTRGTALPEQVPEEFRLAHDMGQAAIVEDSSARVAYWAKLREEWLRPENWYTAYDLDLSWPVRSAQTMSREIMRFIQQT